MLFQAVLHFDNKGEVWAKREADNLYSFLNSCKEDYKYILEYVGISEDEINTVELIGIECNDFLYTETKDGWIGQKINA